MTWLHLQICGQARWWQSLSSPRGLNQGTQTAKNSRHRLTGVISLGPQFLLLGGLFYFSSNVYWVWNLQNDFFTHYLGHGLGWLTIWRLHKHLSFQAASSHGYPGLLHDMVVPGDSFPRASLQDDRVEATRVLMIYLHKSQTIFCQFHGGSDGKESACNAEDPGSVPGLARSPG